VTVQEATKVLEEAVLKRKRNFEVKYGGILKTRMDDLGLEHPMENLSYYNCMHCSEDRTMCMYGKWVIPQEVTDYFPSRVDDDAIMQVDQFIDHANAVRENRAKAKADKTGVYEAPRRLEPIEFLGDFEAREDEKNRLSELRESLKRAGKWREFFEINLDSAILDYRAELYRARRDACSFWEINLKTRKDGSKYREFIHHVCPMHSYYVARNQVLRDIQRVHCKYRTVKCDCVDKERIERDIDDYVKLFYMRPKWDPDFDIGDSVRGWTWDNIMNIEHVVRKRAKVLQRQNRFRTNPMKWDTALKLSWKEFFQRHPDYKQIRNWMRSVTIGKNKKFYGELQPAKHPCGGAAKNTGNALIVGIHAFTPRGYLITRKKGDKGKSLLWEVNLPSWSGEAADWNAMDEEDRKKHLGCEYCNECVFGDSIVLQEDEKGGKLLQFTEDILLDEERFSKVSWMFAKFEEILSIKRDVVVNGKKMKIPSQRQLIVDMTVLDKDVEDHFHQLQRKVR
jgi:hypothetical protein